MNVNRKKAITIFLLILGFIDVFGFFDISKTGELEIVDKYRVEPVRRGNTYYSEHYHFVFEIRYREVDVWVTVAEFEQFQVGDKLKADYKIPINLLRDPYINNLVLEVVNGD